MRKTVDTCGAHVCARSLCGAALVLACVAAAALSGDDGQAAGVVARAGASWRVRARQEGRVDLRLRSFVPGASGQLTVEASAEGGRGRLTALGLPPPESQSRGATTYVVWANSEGRIQRLGELRRDERGNGGLAFTHPAPFDRYTVIVTAERAAEAERPAGAPVLSTRANEAAALFPPDPPATTERATEAPATSNTNTAPAETTPTETPAEPTASNANTSTPTEPSVNANASTPAANASTPTAASPDARASSASPAPARRSRRFRPRRTRAAGDFYGEVDGALDAAGGGRALVLDGDALAPRAEGDAHVAERTGSAYVVARFRDVPLPETLNAGTYVLWAVVPDGRIVYMGSLPADRALNRADIYVRVAGFDSDNFDLFVTAEQRRPASTPSDRRALSTRQPRFIVK